MECHFGVLRQGCSSGKTIVLSLDIDLASGIKNGRGDISTTFSFVNMSSEDSSCTRYFADQAILPSSDLHSASRSYSSNVLDCMCMKPTISNRTGFFFFNPISHSCESSCWLVSATSSACPARRVGIWSAGRLTETRTLAVHLALCFADLPSGFGLSCGSEIIAYSNMVMTIVAAALAASILRPFPF